MNGFAPISSTWKFLVALLGGLLVGSLGAYRFNLYKYQYLAKVSGGEVVATHGDIPKFARTSIEGGSTECPTKMTCGKAFVSSSLPDDLGAWLAIIDLHFQIGGDPIEGKESSHKIESMTKQMQAQINSRTESSATEALRETVYFRPSSEAVCVARLEIFTLRDLFSYQFIDRKQMQRLGAAKSPSDELESRRSLGIGPETNGELLLTHETIGSLYELRLYFGTKYDARKYGKGVAVDRAIRCRSSRPVTISSFLRYQLLKQRIGENKTKVFAVIDQ